jgi:pyruvate,water dikinase
METLSRRFSRWGQSVFFPERHLRKRYEAFKSLLEADERSLLLMAELEEIFSGARQVDPARITWICGQLCESVGLVVERLLAMNPEGYPTLRKALDTVLAGLGTHLAPGRPPAPGPLVVPLAKALGRQESVGGKAANLALAERAGLRVPPCLVVTTEAFRLFLEASGLRPRLNRLLRQVDLSRPERIGPLCMGMQALVLGAPVPEELARPLREAAAKRGHDGTLLAVRSSAVAEDGERSFAGQYASELFVTPESIVDAYRRVAASKYRPRAVTYRVRCGLPDEDTPMAVLVMPMVRATVAGVLHSCDTLPGTATPCVTVYASHGLADAVVSGTREPHTCRLTRRLPATVLDASGDAAVSLAQEALSELVMTGLVLQSVFGRPQEVEWALDEAGRLFVLQSRNQDAQPEPGPERETVRPDGAGLGGPAMAEGLTPVAPGAGCGAVHHLTDGADLARIPAGSVLAVDCLTPSLARCLDRVAAVAARSGSRASHFASIAREARVPVVSGLDNLRARLPEGLLVTVDGCTGRILSGCPALLREIPSARMDEERQRLAKRFESLARQTCHLGLTDPQSPDFAPECCRSLHDLVRYCHEKAVAEMSGMAEQDAESERPARVPWKARRLRTGLAFSLLVLDLGGGVAAGLGDRAELSPEDIASIPLLALWQGLARSGETWRETGFCCDWQEFDRISAGIFRKEGRLLASFALISEDYLHLLVRFGYHFAVLDSLCGRRAEANHIRFRFKGGGGLPRQRRLRAVYIGRVLEACGFSVHVRGDMLTASLARLAQEDIRRALTMLGRLLVRTQRLDLGLDDETQALRLANEFLYEIGHGA